MAITTRREEVAFPSSRDPRFGGNLARGNVRKQYSRAFPGGPPGVDRRYENYRAPYKAEYSPSRNPHHPSHANRTDYMAQGYNSRGELQNYPSRRNMRGKDSYSINVGPRPERDTTGLGGLINRLDTGNIGFTDILNLNPFNKLWPQSWLDALGEDRYFHQDRKDWNDKYYGKADTGSGRMFNQRGISSERQPGLEGGMGEGIGGLQEQAGLWQDWKRIFDRTGNAELADYWMELQQTADASGIMEKYNQFTDKFGDIDVSGEGIEYEKDFNIPWGGTGTIEGQYGDEGFGGGLNFSWPLGQTAGMDTGLGSFDVAYRPGTYGPDYDDDDYGPFNPPSVYEMDDDWLYDPDKDEYEFDYKRGNLVNTGLA